jgi:hypothetical protein
LEEVMRQRPARPETGPPCITGDGTDRIVREGQVMDVGMAVTVYGTGRRPPATQPDAPSLADPDVTEH